MPSALAIVFPEKERAVLEEFEVPRPAEGEVLVRAEVSCVSAGTELSVYLGSYDDEEVPQRYPARPGYANIGHIEEIGASVHGLEVGDRVLTMANHSSHYLRREGKDVLEVIPDDVHSDHAALAVLAQVALSGLQRHPPQLGQSAVVTGQGVIGQFLLQFLKAAGCRPVIAADILDQRLEKSEVSGADLTVNAAKDDAAAAIRSATGGKGADLIYDCTRTAKTLESHFKVAATRGTIVIVGGLVDTVPINFFRDFILRELTLTGTFQPSVPTEATPRTPWTQQGNRKIYLDMLREGNVRTDHLITHKVKPTDAPDIYDMLRKGGQESLGILFDWS